MSPSGGSVIVLDAGSSAQCSATTKLVNNTLAKGIFFASKRGRRNFRALVDCRSHVKLRSCPLVVAGRIILAIYIVLVPGLLTIARSGLTFVHVNG